jgi:hypothetical protein
MAFSNYTWSSSGSLPAQRAQICGGTYNTGTAGYFNGGVQGAPNYAAENTTLKITFSTHAVSTLGSVLSGANYQNTQFSDSGTAGYTHIPIISGGYATRLDKRTFSNETNSSIGNIWPGTVRFGAGLSNKGLAGYSAGGASSGYINSIYKIAFSNDATSTAGVTLSQTRGRLGGYSNEGSSL